MNKKPVALQLWTVRNELAADVPGTLRRVAEIGYTGVELWFAQWPAAGDLKATLSACGLQAIGAHVAFLELRDNFPAVAEYHHTIGNTDVAIPMLPADLRQNEDDWRRRVDEIRQIAERCKAEGLRLSYHNHAMEFTDKVAGQEVHDYLFESIGPDLLQVELDTHFLSALGKDPAAYIRRYAGRLPLLHLKETATARQTGQNPELGQGIIDWDAVFAAADQAGVEWYIVEQNCQTHPALTSVRMNLDFLRSRGVA
jgi:sugar phosphate isomerase/epimerase